MPEFVARLQQAQRPSRHHGGEAQDDEQAEPRRGVADAEEAAPEAIDHVEEGIQVAGHLSKRWQRADRVKHPRQHGQRHDQKVLEAGQLIELFSPQAGHQAQ